MSHHEVEVLVIGGGQAGIAMSEHLSNNDVPHLILERGRIAERWRSERWDSLVSNGPSWHDRLPGMTFRDVAPGDFASKDQLVDYFVNYAEQIGAPIRCGVEVTSVNPHSGKPGFRVETSNGVVDALFVIAATGPFQRPIIPSIVPGDAALTQIHSSAYRNPDQLPDGNVLVVGSGSSGSQIADELSRSGRKVYLSVSAHARPPRRYRGRDIAWWMGVLGLWEVQTPPEGAEHVTLAVSGAHGGTTIDFRVLAAAGITLVGRTESFEESPNHSVIRFAPGLAEAIAGGDANYLALLDAADAYVERNGLNLPEEQEARDLEPLPGCVTDPTLELDLKACGVTSIVWATGFAEDHGWLNVDAFDPNGRPLHNRGVSNEPGFYFLGLPWLSRRASSFIWGVWHDAKYLADQIVVQRRYLAHDPDRSACSGSAPATVGVPRDR